MTTPPSWAREYAARRVIAAMLPPAKPSPRAIALSRCSTITLAAALPAIGDDNG